MHYSETENKNDFSYDKKTKFTEVNFNKNTRNPLSHGSEENYPTITILKP